MSGFKLLYRLKTHDGRIAFARLLCNMLSQEEQSQSFKSFKPVQKKKINYPELKVTSLINIQCPVYENSNFISFPVCWFKSIVTL